jgi:hypothetical protein
MRLTVTVIDLSRADSRHMLIDADPRTPVERLAAKRRRPQTGRYQAAHDYAGD